MDNHQQLTQLKEHIAQSIIGQEKVVVRLLVAVPHYLLALFWFRSGWVMKYQ